jgi:hypothetical protein
MALQAGRPKMRARMSLTDRQALRALILADRQEEARRDAAEMYLTARCLMHLPHRSPGLSEEQRRAEHVRCNGESAGDGCLCPWHDSEQDEEGAVSPADLP